MAHTWDPDRYLAYADERGRPFLDLIARIDADSPRRVVDLGCGPGNLTRLLAQRWPDADVLGIDSSAEMIDKALVTHDGPTAEVREPTTAQRGPGGNSRRLGFEVGDLREWVADEQERVDVLVSNATLQWVPDHLELLPRLVERVSPGGWFAFQVPGNLDEPSHTIRQDLADEERYAAHTAGVAVPDSHDPERYLEVLAASGCTVDAWETTYLHVLTGDDPVFTWVSGTGARPTLEALPSGLREEFEDEFRERLRAAYPRHEYGVLLPFRRVFVVARVGEAA
jgi:trans-aconitate 2-methyltransferase